MKKLLCALALVCLLTGGVRAADYVALTFDDGPSGENTQELLALLDARGTKATFFLCGYRVDAYPALAGALCSAGHEVAVHGYSHTCFDTLDSAQLHAELQTTADRLEELTGCAPTLVRPPCGVYNETVRREAGEAGLAVILWSVDPEDWKCCDAATLARRVCDSAKNGSIILMHDIHHSSVEAAGKIIDELSVRGFRFVTVSRLAELSGCPLAPGEVYSRFSCAQDPENSH